MARNPGKLTIGLVTSGVGSRLNGTKVLRKSKTGKFMVEKAAVYANVEGCAKTVVHKTSAPQVDDFQVTLDLAYRQPDLGYVGLAVVEPVEAWCGDPRKMRDEDLAFFGLER